MGLQSSHSTSNWIFEVSGGLENGFGEQTTRIWPFSQLILIPSYLLENLKDLQRKLRRKPMRKSRFVALSKKRLIHRKKR